MGKMSTQEKADSLGSITTLAKTTDDITRALITHELTWTSNTAVLVHLRNARNSLNTATEQMREFVTFEASRAFDEVEKEIKR